MFIIRPITLFKITDTWNGVSRYIYIYTTFNTYIGKNLRDKRFTDSVQFFFNLALTHAGLLNIYGFLGFPK